MWVETDHAECKLSKSSNYSPGVMAPLNAMYFVFLNEDPYPKEVQYQITRVWNETNYLPILGGIAMIPIGMIMGIGLKVNKLQIGYLVCAYMTGFLIMPFFLALAWDFGCSPIFVIMSNIQHGILFASLPLGTLIYLWSEKGGGSAHLQSWTMGKNLRIAGLLLLCGVLMNAALITIDTLTLWNFSSTHAEIESGVTRVSNPLYFGLFGISCILILSGVVIFSGLWLRKTELLA